MKKSLKFIIIGAILVGLIVGYYFYLSHKSEEASVPEETASITYVQQLIGRNLDEDYPPTVKEVMKLYADITVAFYNENYQDNEFDALALKMRELFDPELQDANPAATYINNLKAEIVRFKGQGIKVSSYSLPASTEVDYFKEDGFEFARINLSLTMWQNKYAAITREKFLLRKDINGRWKIYGWVAEESKNDEGNN